MFDWLTVIAQLVNFIILVWLLKRFLYKPIINAIGEREKLIAKQVQDANTIKAEAIRACEDIKRKNIEFDQQRQTLLNTAINEVDAVRIRLLEESRKEAEALRLKLHENLISEQQNLGSEIMRHTQMEVFAIVRKTLIDLASAKLEAQMADVFIIRLKEMKLEENDMLLSALKASSNQVFVRSTFELPPFLQTAIETVIKNNFATEVKINVEIAPHLISGIELIAGGYKVVWSIEDYLLSFEASLTELLEEKTRTKQ
jgi:F-type H+-transporting ATPase subunit b